jgi:hypothetical protein
MRWNSFGSSLVFAAAAAAGWPAFAVLAGPLLGLGGALSLYAMLVVAFHVFGSARRPARGVMAACLALGLGAGVLLLTRGAGEAVVGSALVLGVVRSGLLYRACSARALLTEAALLGGGLALARFLAVPGLLGAALGIWGFFLVQSVFFLIGGVRERRAEVDGLDPFDLARTRLAALLEEE